MSSTLGVRHQQTRWFPAPLGRLGAGPVAVEAAAGVMQGAEDRLEVSKMASRENGDFGVAFVEEDEEDEECSDAGREDGEGVVRRTFRFVLPESPTDDADGGEEDEEGSWSEDRSSPAGRSAAASFVSEDDGAKPEEKEGDNPPTDRRPCSVVLDPLPSDVLRSLSSVGKNGTLRSTPPPLAGCDDPPRPLPPLHPQPKARPVAVVDPSCEGPRRRLSAPAVSGGPPTPPGGGAPLMAGAPLRHRRCSCHGAGARSPRPAIDPPTLPPRRHGGAWASRDVMTTSDPDVEVLEVAEEEARGGGKECREERGSVGEEEEVRRALRKRAKRRRRRREEDEEGGRSSGETEREIRSVERNNYRKRSCSSSTTASSSTASSTSTAFSVRRRHKHRKRRRRRARPLESEEDVAPVASEETSDANPTPRVNPIFVWAKQDDAATILEVLCEDYDKRNRIRLTKTANGWRAIPRTERLAAATATSSGGQKEAPTSEGASNSEGPPDPSVLLRLPLSTTVTPPPRRRSRGDAKEKSKKESRKGIKAIPKVTGSSDEKKPREDHSDSPGQPETYGGEGPGRPDAEDENSSGTSVVQEETSAASKPRQVKPRDQRLVNKRVRKAPVKRAKPRKKPVVKKSPTPPPVLVDDPPVEDGSEISKENEENVEAIEVATPKREPVRKAPARSRRKNSRVVRTPARSRARLNNARRLKAKKVNVVATPPLQSPEEADEVEKVEGEVEEMNKDEEEVVKDQCVEEQETEENEELSIKETESTEGDAVDEVPSEEVAEAAEEENEEEVPGEGEGEEDVPNSEEASEEVQESEVVEREDEEMLEAEEADNAAEENGTIAEGVEDEGAVEEDGDAESHAEAVMEEEAEEVEASADHEENIEAEMAGEENPEVDEVGEGAEGVVDGDVVGENLEEGIEEAGNEEEGEGAPEAEIEESETTAVEEGEVSEEAEAQVEEGEVEEAPVEEEEETEGVEAEAAEEEEAEEEEEDDDEEDEDDEDDDEEEEDSPPKTPPPAHAASHPALLVPQVTEGEGLQEEPADLTTQKRKAEEADETPPFKKVRRSHVTGLLPSTRITTCPRSLLPPKEAPPTNPDPTVPAPAHSSEPYQPIAPTMNDEKVMVSKTPQKDALDLVHPPSEEPSKLQIGSSQKDQWRKVSSSEGSKGNSEEKADANSNLGENLTLEPPLKKIKVEVEEEEEPTTEMMEPNVEDSHQITLKKLLSSKEANPNPGLPTSVDIVVPKPKVELAFPVDASDASAKSCARSRLLELLTSPDAHKSSPSPSRSTPMQRTPSPATPTVTSRPYSHPPPAVKIEPRTDETDGGCDEGKAGLELKKLKDLLGKQSTAKLTLKQVALENPAPLALKQVVSPPETTITRLPTPERQPTEPIPMQRTTPITSRADTVRVPQPTVRSNNKSKSSHQSMPHNRTASRGSNVRETNSSARTDVSGGAEQDAATAAAAAALHNMLWLPYLGQLEMAVNTGNRELLASLGNAMFGPPPPISPSSQSSTSPRALSHFPTPPPPQNPPFVHGNPFLHPTSLPPSAIADYKSRVEISQTLNLWQDIMAANASSAFNSAHQDLLSQESLERNGGTNGLVICQRQDVSVSSHIQERQSPRYPHNGRKPSPVSTPLSPSHSPSADFLRYINSGVFSGASNGMPRPHMPQNNNQFNVCYNGVHSGNSVHSSGKHSYNEQKAHSMRHPTPSQIYRNIETNSSQLQQTLSLASASRPRKSPSTSAADSTQSKNSSRRQPLSSPRDESIKIPTSSSSNNSQKQKSGLTCRSLLNLLSNPQADGAESVATENMGDESTRMDQQRHGHLLAALARPSSTQSDKRAISMSRFPPIPSSLCPQVIGLDPDSEYLQAARFSAPLSGVGQSLLPAGVQPMDLSGRSGGKSSKREERAAEMEAFRSQEVAASLNTASGSAHPHLWHPLFGSQKTCDPWRWRTVAVNGD